LSTVAATTIKAILWLEGDLGAFIHDDGLHLPLLNGRILVE
jgi:hypothetical protein